MIIRDYIMKKYSNNNKLRDKAEEILSENLKSEMPPSDDFPELVHELQTHQIELEMQNKQFRRSQEELEEAKLKYFNLYEFAPMGYFTLDKKEIIKETNLAGAALLGVKKPEVINSAFIQFMTSESRRKFYKHLEIVKKTGPGQTCEVEFIKNDGNKVYAHLNTFSTLDDEKKFKKFIITATDITELKKAENALRASEEKYRTLFESNLDYTILTDLDGVLADVNPAVERITGLSKDELVGKHFSELEIFPKEEFVLHKKNFSELLVQGNVDPLEARIIDKNGKFRWVLNKFTTVIKNDKMEYVLIIGTDITERKQAEDEIKSSLEEKEVLLKEIHHRVKNNLQIISSLLDLQEAYVQDDSTAVNVLHESQNRVFSMALLHQMLYQSNDFTGISFDYYIRDLVSNLFNSYSKNKRITPVITVDDIYLKMETAVPCGLIISELVSNSLKYAYPDNGVGELNVSLKSLENEFELIISDDGVGFPEDLDFRNIKSSLGLKLVNLLVQQLDGTIDLDRSHGTEFKIKFKELKYKQRI